MGKISRKTSLPGLPRKYYSIVWFKADQVEEECKFCTGIEAGRSSSFSIPLGFCIQTRLFISLINIPWRQSTDQTVFNQ